MYRNQALTEAARVRVITSNVFTASDSLFRESSFVMGRFEPGETSESRTMFFTDPLAVFGIPSPILLPIPAPPIVWWFRSSLRIVLHDEANFGFGTLVYCNVCCLAPIYSQNARARFLCATSAD